MLSAKNSNFLPDWMIWMKFMVLAVCALTASAAAVGRENEYQQHMEFSLLDVSLADCIQWQGTYNYASTNSLGQLVVNAASSPCDPSACCCWQNYVRVDCEFYGDQVNRLSVNIDRVTGQLCDKNDNSDFYKNDAIYWTEVDVQQQSFNFNNSKATVAGSYTGAVASNAKALDQVFVGDGHDDDVWNLYFYRVNGTVTLSALNQASASCSSMFTLINTDQYYQFPAAVTYNFPLVAWLVGLGEACVTIAAALILIFLSRKYPHWRLFVSDEETRRNKRAERIKKKADLMKAKKEAKERKEKEKAERANAEKESKLDRTASQIIRSKVWGKTKKDKKPKDAKEAVSQSESAAFYHEIAHLDSASALEKMESWLGGLSTTEVQERLAKYGKNIPAKEDRWAVFRYFFKSLVNPFNFLLVSLAILTYTFPPPGDPVGGSIIMFMVVLSVAITFAQDYRANNAIAKLKSMVKSTTVVYRRSDGEEKAEDMKNMNTAVAATSGADHGAGKKAADNLVSKRVDVDVVDIVPGDILFLTAGSVIPADVRIISCKDLFVAQSALTGESFPVEKSPHISLDVEKEVEKPKTAPMHKVKKTKEKRPAKKSGIVKPETEEQKIVVAIVPASNSVDEQKAPLIEERSNVNSNAAPSETGSSAATSSAAATSDSAGNDAASANELASPSAAATAPAVETEEKKVNALDALADERFFDTATGQAFGGDEDTEAPRSGRLDEDEEEDDNNAVELSRSAVHWYMQGVEGDTDEELPSTERIDTSQIHLHLDSRLRAMDRDDAARQHIEPIVTGLKDAVAAAMSEHSRLRFEKKDDEENELQTYEESEEVEEDEDEDDESAEEEKRQSDNDANEKDKGEVAIEMAPKAAPSTDKPTAAAAGNSDSIFEHANLAFMGSSVTSGVATAVVIRTGTKTVLGELATMLTAMKPPTSFERGISAYVALMFKFMLGMGIFVTLINGLSGKSWFESFGFAITVAIGITPEMLPVVITVNLAKGAMDLLNKKVIVKRLISVQNLGAVEVLCTDKTGTLTDDRIQLHQYLDVDGNVQPSVLLKAAINSSFQTAFRNMLDENVIQKALEHQPAAMEGLKKLTKVDEVPFDFNRKRMSVIVKQEEQEHVLICKGAAEEMIKLSTSLARFPKAAAGSEESTLSAAAILSEENTIEKVGEEKRDELIGMVHKMNGQGFRVVCVAIKRMIASDAHTYGVNDEKDMTLIGFLVFLDPPKEGVEKSIASLHKRGVHIKVCTGDNEKVTHYVCQRIGIPVNRILLGSEIGRMNDESLQKAVHECDIFAKLSPLDKERVVKAIKATGRSVGFLGDGVNDAAALKAADVGISVDNAVEIAKESADVILLTKSLDVLDRGVLLGRNSFANIIKYIKMAASSNFGNMFSVLGLSAMLPATPLQPVQILVNNLLYDFSQIALPFDSVDPEWVAQPRQWDMKDLASFIFLIGPTSSVFDYWTWAMSWYLLGYHVDTKKSLTQAQTVWWMESLFSQTLIVHLIRTKKIPFVQSRASLWLIGTTLIIMAIACILPYIPGTSAIPLIPVNSQVFGWIVLEMTGYWCLTSIVKSLYYKIWPNSSC